MIGTFERGWQEERGGIKKAPVGAKESGYWDYLAKNAEGFSRGSGFSI